MGKNFSLRHTLISRLAIWQTATLLVLAAGTVFMLFDAEEFPAGLLDPELTEILAEATQAGPSGPVVNPTPELSALQESSPRLWFVIRDAEGRETQGGTPPAELASLVGALDRLEVAQIWGDPSGQTSAIIAIHPSAAGEIKVFAGGTTPPGTLEKFVKFAVKDVLPLTVLIVVVLFAMSFVAMPRIIESALAGLRRVVERAALIDIDKRGTRLPTLEVPAEILVLVDAINAALERLDRGYAKQERFLADAAHELKTPIAILQNRIELLAPGTDLGDRLLLDVQRIANLAEQLLDLQRLDHQDTAPRQVDLVALCRQVIGDLAPIAINAGYEPGFVADTPRMMVDGDASAIERAVINLVQNAIAHGGGAGVVQVRVLADRTIEVSDNGPGIPADRREWIFEPFHRLKPLERGSGLGLSLVREIMRRHGGSVAVDSSIGGGARFILRFPQSRQPASELQLAPAYGNEAAAE